MTKTYNIGDTFSYDLLFELVMSDKELDYREFGSIKSENFIFQIFDEQTILTFILITDDSEPTLQLIYINN